VAKYPSLKTFLCALGDETACRIHLAQMRWPDGIECPKCHGSEVNEIRAGTTGKGGARVLNHCQECDHNFSDTVGTIFHDHHRPLADWFLAIYLMGSIENGIRATQMKKYLGVNYSTAKKMVRCIRQAIKDDKNFVKSYLPSRLRGGAIPEPQPNRNSHPTLHATVHKFGTDLQCRDYLAMLRWKNGPECPKCKNGRVEKIQSKIGRARRTYRCLKCKKQFSAISGTPFSGLHKLSEWFLTIYLMESNADGIPARQLERLLGVSSRTASSLAQQFRKLQEQEQTRKLFKRYISFHDHAKARAHELAMAQMRDAAIRMSEQFPEAHRKRWFPDSR
jgi:transposase-like protein